MGNLIKKSKNIIKNKLITTFISRKFLLVFLLTFTNVHMIVAPLKRISSLIPINPLIVPFIMENRYEKLLIIIPLILLFNDFGKITKFDEQLIVRSSRNSYLFSNIISILVISLLYFFIIILLTIIVLVPNIEFTNEYGRCIDTLIKTNAASNLKIPIGFSSKIYEYFTPFQSNVFYLILNTFSGFIIGLIIYFFNLKNKPLLANFITTLFLVMDTIKFLKNKTYKYNFISWVNLSYINIDELYSPYYSYNKIIFLYFLIIMVLISIIFIYFQKRDM